MNGKANVTSNSGNTSRRFFRQEVADVVVDCVQDKYKEDIRLLHQYLSVILRVIASWEWVNCVKFEAFSKKTSTLIAEKFPWVDLNWTLHGMLHHSAELITGNGGWSIGTLSEEPLESNNKFIRRYLEQHSRKMSPQEQLHDSMHRLLERSNPDVLDLQKHYEVTIK